MKFKGDMQVERLHYLGQMDTLQRSSTTPSAPGALIFDTTVGKPFIFDGTAWKELGGNNPSTDTYNSLSIGSDGGHFYNGNVRYATWNTPTFTIAPQPPTGPITIYEYNASSPTPTTCTINLAPAGKFDGVSTTEAVFVKNNSGGDIDFVAGSGLTLYGATKCFPGDIVMVIYSGLSTATVHKLSDTYPPNIAHLTIAQDYTPTAPDTVIPLLSISSNVLSGGLPPPGIQLNPGGQITLSKPENIGTYYRLVATIEPRDNNAVKFQWRNVNYSQYIGTQGYSAGVVVGWDEQKCISAEAYVYINPGSSETVALYHVDGSPNAYYPGNITAHPMTSIIIEEVR
ncbi:MAG: hypothetical protein D6698_10520 [Gammaproteobacteria bacterium]|nr:MAG: hypothetical protein D6698_10520 [Gammaproteobacteria bacterium]